jgi:putative RecB family exonuclease
MTALTTARVTVDPPSRLPVDYLSLTSLKLFMSCPTKWRRRYLEHEPEPPSGKLILGKSSHGALAQHYGVQLESGTGLCTEDVLDEFASDWDARVGDGEVDWGTDRPGQLKDSGAGALRVYHTQFAPRITPVAVEREFELSWPGVEWVLTGWLDLEDTENRVRDYKATGRRISQKDADGDLQPTVLLTARRAEHNPAAGFAFDAMVRTKRPTAEVVHTVRSQRQLDLLTDRIFALAREIEWRCETGVWSGAPPGTWFCQTCRYADCPLRLGVLG